MNTFSLRLSSKSLAALTAALLISTPAAVSAQEAFDQLVEFQAEQPSAAPTQAPVKGKFKKRDKKDSGPTAVFKRASESVVKIITSDKIGSGTVIDRDGNILTNAHVVDSATKVTIQFFTLNPDGTTKLTLESEAKVIGKDDDRDIAIVRVSTAEVPADRLHPIVFGNSDAIMPGNPVYLIGSPYGIPDTLTAGIVSAKARQGDKYHFIQTDAAMNPGNSGGPMLNAKGEQIGINDYIHTKGGGSEGIGMAIPLNRIQLPIQQIIKGGKTTHGIVGYAIAMMEKPTRMALAQVGYPGSFGVIVKEIAENKPAQKAGLKIGDVLYKVNEEEITTVNDAVLAVNDTEPGEEVVFDVFRGGKIIKIKVVVEDRDGAALPSKAASPAPATPKKEAPKPTAAEKFASDCNQECGEAGCNCEKKKTSDVPSLGPSLIVPSASGSCCQK